MTYDGNKLCTYLNGVLAATNNITLSEKNKTSGEFFLGRDYRTSETALKGRLNDFRVYDHCLSAAEVHEISQGLVLHYKLDHFAQPNLLTGNINLIAQWTADGVTRTQDGSSIKVVNNNSGNHRIYNGVSNVWTTSGQKFTVSFDAKATANGHIIQASRSLGDLAPETTLTTEWKHYTVQLTNTASVTDGTLSIQSKTSSGTFWIRNVKLEKGTVESRFVLPGENDTSIKDSSGYGHNGTITGVPALNSNTPRYSSCINLTSGQKISVTGLLTSSDPIWTTNFWVKMYSNTYTAWADVITFKGNKPIRVEVSNSNGKNLAWYNYPLGTSNGIPISNINYDEWNMITMVWNGTSILSYFNGVLKYTATISGTAWTPNGEMTIGDTGMYMYMSDVRIYCTALSADDILSLYHTAAKVDNLGGLHTFEAIENIPNIIFKIDSARGAKVFQDGLSRYTQANCQVTLTENGYRIYRPPNLTTSANGNTMWGGLKLVNQNIDTVSPYNATRDNIWGLQQGHTYLWAFHAKGQSSNATSFGFTNNMGWGVGGVSPGPTVLVNNGIPANFQGEKECLCLFTIGDNIIKTSNDNRGGYDGSSQYLSYRHLTFGWGYSSTGELGTDVYLTNLRLYDITNFIGQIKKNGQANFSDFVENSSIARILKNAEFLTNNLIEK